MGSGIYILSTKVDFCFAVYKLEKFSSNPVKLHFDGLVHLLRYIRDNKHLGLIYYTKIEDAAISDILRQVITKNENRVIVFSDSIWKYCQDTVRSRGVYIVFYQGVPIDHFTHVPGPVDQFSAES